MKKTYLLVVGAIAVIAVLVLAGVVPVSLMFIDTNTKSYSFHPDDENPVKGIIPPELSDETELVTAWKDGGNSIKLTFEGRALIPKCPWIGYHPYRPVRYYYKVYIIDQDHSTWHEIMWRDNYDRDMIHITHPTTGFFGAKRFTELSYSTDFTKYLDVYDENGVVIGKDYISIPVCGPKTITGDAYSIELKDSHVGALKVEFWVTICPYGWDGTIEHSRIRPYCMLKDEVKLLDGAGDLSIANEKTVYEEGETITFVVDTGFSGATQGGDVANLGWELRVYDATGSQVKAWAIPDDRRGYTVSYVIPDGSYNPSGSNQWKAELWNTLFNQKEAYFFTIGVGMTEQIPGLPTISFDRTTYDMGDTCYVTVSSVPNPLGRNTIYEFFVKAYYSSYSTDYLYGPTYIRAGANKATFSFTLTRGDRYVTVEANAFDAPHDQGGLMSETAKNTIWVSDKDPAPSTYVLTVYVKSDGEAVKDATVSCTGDQTDVSKSIVTDSSGRASFIGLPQDTYDVSATKRDYGSGSATVILDKDKTITINLSPTADILQIVVALLIFICFFIIGFVLMKRGGIYVSIGIMALGAVIALLYYFFGSQLF